MVTAHVAPQLPGYRDLTPIGEGGFSMVYRAWQERFDRWVALKILSIPAFDERARERFRRECRVTGRLSGHPHVVVVHDADVTSDGRPYLAMQLYEGGSTLDRLQRNGPLPVDDVLQWAIQVAGALETGHRAGVLHRDVKPGNILLTPYDVPVLTDFGLSIVAETQERSMGVDALTPNHAAPEVLERGEASPATDVFSLASTAYMLLAGRPPHPAREGEGPATRLLRMLEEPVPRIDRSDVPEEVQAALLEGLARDPADRPPSAEAFARRLQDVQEALGLPVTEATVVDARRAPPAPLPTPPPGEATLPRAPAATPPSDTPAPAAPSTDQPTVLPPGAVAPPPPAEPVEREPTVAIDRPRPPTEPAEKPPSSIPLPVVIMAVVAVVALVGLLASYLLADDEDDPPPTTAVAYVPEDVPTDVEATATPLGVRVTWTGDDDAEFVVLVLSEDAERRGLPADTGTDTLLDPDLVDPDAGHCFAVAYAVELARAPEGSESAAFSPPVCINGATRESVGAA